MEATSKYYPVLTLNTELQVIELFICDHELVFRITGASPVLPILFSYNEFLLVRHHLIVAGYSDRQQRRVE